MATIHIEVSLPPWLIEFKYRPAVRRKYTAYKQEDADGLYHTYTLNY